MNRIKLKKMNRSYDKKLLFFTIFFTFLGVIFVLNASGPEAINKFSDRFYFAKQQLVWGIAGLFIMIIVSKINYNFWKRTAIFIFVISLVLLILVLIPTLGVSALGAKRWIDIGITRFQPSEFVKIALVIYLARVASSEKNIISYLVPVLLIIALVMFQPDLGTTIVISIIAFSQIFISGIEIIKLIYLAFIGLIGGFLLIITSDYRRERLMSFLNPLSDTLGRSYHIKQILYALGSGGLFGVGLGQSRQKYLFLPEAATDSIFAVIAEEIGFIGTLALIILIILFVRQCLKIANNAPDKFSKVLAIGITAWIGGQTIINLTSMVALTPLTGIPLPFISYGGSALISILIACGILLNISRYTRVEK
jgi:cell division protein FtsW